jgi:hypothetical protein
MSAVARIVARMRGLSAWLLVVLRRLVFVFLAVGLLVNCCEAAHFSSKGVNFSMIHVVHVSSNANNGANAGAFYVNANNDSSNRNRNIGSQLAVFVASEINSFPLGRICRSNTVW